VVQTAVNSTSLLACSAGRWERADQVPVTLAPIRPSPDQTIRYRSGKSGTGPEQSISYANYLERRVRIFLQTTTLLRIELIVGTDLEVRHPI
jgi:hypothetical protein